MALLAPGGLGAPDTAATSGSQTPRYGFVKLLKRLDFSRCRHLGRAAWVRGLPHIQRRRRHAGRAGRREFCLPFRRRARTQMDLHSLDMDMVRDDPKDGRWTPPSGAIRVRTVSSWSPWRRLN